LNFEGHIFESTQLRLSLEAKLKSQGFHLTSLTQKVDSYHSALQAIPAETLKDPVLKGLEAHVRNMFRQSPSLIKSFNQALKQGKVKFADSPIQIEGNMKKLKSWFVDKDFNLCQGEIKKKGTNNSHGKMVKLIRDQGVEIGHWFCGLPRG
jgi:hypothetical protein